MIELKDVNKEVAVGKKQTKMILKSVNLHVPKGDMIAIMGKSGAGKTTLLNIIGMLDSFSEGEYRFQDTVIKPGEHDAHKFRGRRIGMITQNYSLVEAYTVYENVEVPLDFCSRRMSKKERKERILDALNQVGMLEKTNQRVMTLSGGEKQRVAIARAIVNKPELLIADEPTGALDTENSNNIMDILETLNQQGNTIILVTHDPEIAQRCKRIIYIKDGVLENTDME